VLLTGILVLILEALRQVDSHIYQPMGVYPIPESPNKKLAIIYHQSNIPASHQAKI
jgi:hypothetical protein